MSDKQILTRKQYDTYRKLDRKDFEKMIEGYIQQGRETGIKEFIEFVLKRKGVGPKTIGTLNTALRDFLGTEV